MAGAGAGAGVRRSRLGKVILPSLPVVAGVGARCHKRLIMPVKKGTQVTLGQGEGEGR